MLTTTELYAFIRSFPKFVDFLKTAYKDFKEVQIKMAESEAHKKIEELETQIARLKSAKTNTEIADTIASINRG